MVKSSVIKRKLKDLNVISNNVRNSYQILYILTPSSLSLLMLLIRISVISHPVIES